MNQCKHEGCSETKNLTACYYPANGETPDSELFAGHYCYDHAKTNGFCFGCGQFWSGVESFDFPEFWGNVRGYCDNCSYTIKSDCGELDEDDEEEEEDYYYEEWMYYG